MGEYFELSVRMFSMQHLHASKRIQPDLQQNMDVSPGCIPFDKKDSDQSDRILPLPIRKIMSQNGM